YAGFSMPLGQGLFLDKRRAALGKAKIFAESTEAEKQKLINDLFFDALKDYWKWVEIWNKYKIYDESLVLAKTRFAAVKQSFLLGDKPAIDTLESFIQVQNLQMNLNEFELLYQNATLELSNYLWFENNLPLEITNGLHPPLISELNPVLNPTGIISDSIYSINFSHPDLKLYQYKLSSMDIEKRLMAEYLKPKINLQYKTLNQPGINSSLNAIPFQNYSWGLEFGFPLFLRQQRGDLQLTKLAINEIELQFQQKQLELQNKIKSYFNEIRILENQIALFTDAVGNYNKMLQGEKQKFDLGESSLFLINSREMSLIQANLKLIELKSKYRISHAGIKWAMGTLYLY
ncbi:MAG: TolC family protein, partial [Cyclobacteriaceae bacterium]|nr:TolC family protein [Cyclobacteriaceae bacterium]